MYKYKSEFLNFINERGFLNQISDAESLDKSFMNKGVSAYIGFDCTAPSLHIGSLIQIMLLKHLQDFGHNPIVLVGGGTSKVGDPSLKDKSRSLLEEKEIRNNLNGIKKTFGRFIDLKKTGTVVVDNNEWLGSLNYIDFLREVGSNFSVNRMLSFDSVKLRLEREQPLSFLEFNYMVMQGYDFYELNKRYKCILQMGGSDQWGNIVCGIDLARRLSGVNLFGLTTPLLTTSSGQKMGKTENGAIWLNYDKDAISHSTHPRDFWNYWRDKTDNNLVGPWMRLFTSLSLKEISEYEKLQGEEIEFAKEVLATKITELVHGKDSNWNSIETFKISKLVIEEGVGLLSLLSKDFLKLTNSNSESRRFVKSSAIKLNEKLILDEKYIVTIDDFDQSQKLKISMGKKKNILVQISE
ncbi:MAG: tyrosine--tRNA ligase [Hyphomicrobiales bacterium]|jgi:tyrosyl-tRNA synthetase|nr:tyrosine--tRNA ligase [Hyphomicrobiales bacterium]MDG1665048.1 tyrosine--tRNA ligase [Hyphomicrobiales bacterium]MDG2414422.1 tyrosine--tRNA ligase [Hyphomicrobiales bacterium]